MLCCYFCLFFCILLFLFSIEIRVIVFYNLSIEQDHIKLLIFAHFWLTKMVISYGTTYLISSYINFCFICTILLLVVWLIWVSSWKAKGQIFGSPSGHMPRLWVQSTVRGVWEATDQCLSLPWMFLFLFSSSVPSKQTIKQTNMNNAWKKCLEQVFFYLWIHTEFYLKYVLSDSGWLQDDYWVYLYTFLWKEWHTGR